MCTRVEVSYVKSLILASLLREGEGGRVIGPVSSLPALAVRSASIPHGHLRPTFEVWDGGQWRSVGHCGDCGMAWGAYACRGCSGALGSHHGEVRAEAVVYHQCCKWPGRPGKPFGGPAGRLGRPTGLPAALQRTFNTPSEAANTVRKQRTAGGTERPHSEGSSALRVHLGSELL